MGNLTVPDIFAVQPDKEAGINTFKVQINLGCVCVGDIFEGMNVGTAGVLMGNIGRIKGKGILDIGVLICIVTIHLPNAGNRNGIESSGIIVGRKEGIRQIVDAGIVAELPLSVKQLETVRVFTVMNKILHPVGSGDEVGTQRHCVFVKNLQILKMLRYDHENSSLQHDGGLNPYLM